MLSKRLYGLALMGAVASMAFTQGCSSDNPLCCTSDDFQAGGTVTASIGGSAKSQVAVQAVADFAGIADASIADLTSACRGIATDLGATSDSLSTAEANADNTEKMKAYCKLAVNAIGTIKGSAQLNIAIKPPVCEASISAKADCQAKCSGGVKCDLKANPPKCTGGKLSVACKGECTVTAEQPKISCTGVCKAQCSGKCSGTATAPSVTCNGRCNGTCEGSTDSGGNCNGKCNGTCEIKGGADIQCEGSCDGECTGSCEASGGVDAKCSGDCKADYEPISCSGGKLEGGCQADVKCDANCNASVKAKASCSPPEIAITFSSQVEGAAKLQATLEANLPAILAIKGKLEAAADVTASFTANIDANVLTDIKAACIPSVVSAAGGAVGKITASVQATADISGTFTGS